MKYDADLQEIDAIRRARSVYEEESAPSWWKEMRKRTRSVAEEESERRRKYTRTIIMLPMPRARAVCLELRGEKRTPSQTHSSSGSRREARTLSSDDEGYRNIVRPSRARGCSQEEEGGGRERP